MATATQTATEVLLVGTRKGVFVLAGDDGRASWDVRGPMFLGHIAQHVVLDPRDRRRMLMAARTGHLGPTLFWSDDLGETWHEASKPPAFRSGEPLARSLDAVFWLTPGPASRPGRWYAGGSPQGMFVSDDGGDTWEPFDGWNDHPMWSTWCEWPEQNTPDGSMLHSITVDPRDDQHIYLGLSSGGVFESTDGGSDWRPLNRGCVTAFLPETEPEFGHDPHCVRMHPSNPDRLWQQNHCGIYRLDRPGERWERVGDNMPADVGDIGFPVDCIRVTPTPCGCSRWTARTCGRAPAPTVDPRCTSRTTPVPHGSGRTAGSPSAVGSR
jgi:hypothetical protein